MVNLHVCKQGRVVEFTRHIKGSREYKEMYMGGETLYGSSLYGSGAVCIESVSG